jgi:hypothetical protein
MNTWSINRLFFVLIAAGSLFFLTPHAEAANWYNTAWAYRNLLTINSSSVTSAGATSSTYNNFTVLVSFASNSQLQTAARASGTDILFTQSDGVTLLNYEIEHYVSSTGELEAWVKMPTISTSSNTLFYMYYGNPSATSSLQNANNTWDSSYSAVYHFPNGTTLSAKDSTVNAYNGTIYGAAGATSAGEIDGAMTLNGTSQFVSSSYLQASTTAATYEAWIKVPNTQNKTAVIIQDRGPGSGHSLTLALDGDYACGSTSCGATLGNISAPTGKLMFGDDSANIWIGVGNTVAPINNNAWHFVVGTFAATSGLAIATSDFKIYIDGAATTTGTSGNTGNDHSPLTGLGSTTFGYHQAWNAFFLGAIDEIRISKVVRPLPWISTEYKNESSPSTFIMLGPQESPPSFTQSAYRWFANVASTTVGQPLAAQNVTTTAQLVTSSTFRLRMLLRVAGSQANSGTQSFNLQYVDAGTGTCASPSGGNPASYTNIATSSGIFQFLNNGIADGEALTPTSTDPVDGSNTIVNQTYEQANPFSNSLGDIPAGADGKWDFALTDNGAKVGAAYCFRAVTASGTALSSYAVYPVVVIGNVPPTVGPVTLNGNNNITLTIATTTPVTVTTTVSDGNGYADIASATAMIYRTSLGPSCALNNNNCYQTPACSLTACFGMTCNASCSANVWYFAQPTDANTPWAGDSWSATVNVSDHENATGTASSTGVSLLSLLGLRVATSINYGTFSPGQGMATLTLPVAIANVGNVSLNTTLYGTNMTSGSNIVAVGDQHYATSSIIYPSGTALLANPGTTIPLAIPKTTSTIPAGATFYWGIALPNPQPSGNFTGVNTFIAVENALPWP